jgi:hypothetical protein
MPTPEELAMIRSLRKQNPRLSYPEAERIVKGEAEAPVGSGPSVRFPNGRYLGGNSGLGAPGMAGNLVVTDQLIGIGIMGPTRNAVSLSNVTSIEVEAATHAKNATARTLAFGVLGGVSGAKTKDVTNVIVHTDDGAAAYYQIDNSDAMRVKAQMTPVLIAAGVSMHGHAPAPSQAAPTSVADELRKLAELRDSGVLTDDEFATQKRRLLEA